MKEDIKYPYIGKAGRHEVIFTSKNSGIDLENFNFYMNGFNEYQFKNITSEYLSNTYGKVESKEHAEFIFDLGDINDFSSRTDYTEEYPFWFCFDDDELFFFDNESDANDNGEKLITIPLPPKQIQTATSEEEFEMQQIMKNNGDNLVLGCEESKCKEWPCVNDEVLTSDGNGVVKLLPDSKGYYVVSVNGEYYQYQIDELSKTKTPEEELRDDIVQTIHDDVYHGACEKQYLEVFANALMSKYNITKKPE